MINLVSFNTHRQRRTERKKTVRNNEEPSGHMILRLGFGKRAPRATHDHAGGLNAPIGNH